jgi:surfeit locus 1 family protein
MQRPRVRLFWPGATLMAGSVLVSFGVWQFQRLESKERLIAEIEVRAHATPQPLPAAEEWPKFRPEDYEYRHVAARGKFEHDKEALVFRAGREPGYHMLTPLRLNSGGYVLVNRGFVPVECKEQTSRLAGQIPEKRRSPA